MMFGKYLTILQNTKDIQFHLLRMEDEFYHVEYQHH